MTRSRIRIRQIIVALAAALGAVTATHADDHPDLSLAVRQGNLAAVRAIVEKNATLATTADGSGLTPLHAAAFDGSEEVARLLIAHGADIEAGESDGRSARDLAEHRSASIDRMLAAKGARTGLAAFPSLTGPYLDQ